MSRESLRNSTYPSPTGVSGQPEVVPKNWTTR